MNPEALLAGKYGRSLHVWDLRKRRHLQALDLGAEQQMVLELRPAHDPTKAYGFVGVVVSLKDLSSSIWLWHRSNDKWEVKKVIEIPAEPAEPEQLPPLLKGFKAVPPLLTDINLSLDDRYLYASNWGTGELQQYDVSDPFHPKLSGSVHIGGIVRRTAHPGQPKKPLNGGPQMVEVSRDGRRVYFTNSLYAAWDQQFYPDGIQGRMAKMHVSPDGGITLDKDFVVDFGDLRSHQVRLQGGDASSGLLLLSMKNAWPRVTLTLPGAYHGLNPGMGWLFALSLGLQEKSRRAVLSALLPILFGHATAISLAILGCACCRHFCRFEFFRSWWREPYLLWASTGCFGPVIPACGGMKVGFRDLFLWSFLMATADGAGLMLAPILLAQPMPGMSHSMPSSASSVASLGVGVLGLAVGVHTLGLALVAGTLSLAVYQSYETSGLRLLQRAWFNFDLLWAVALLVAGVAN